MVIVTRRDLFPGAQAAQTAHALALFSIEHPEVFIDWHNTSNYIVILSADNENSLKNLILKTQNKNLRHSIFVEPDMNHQVTAIALEPCDETYKLVSNLPLAMKEYSEHYKNLKSQQMIVQ